MNKSPMNMRKRGNDTPTPEVPQSRATKIAVLRRMCSYLFKHKLLVLMAFALMLSSNLLALAGPKISGLAIDAIEFGEGHVVFDDVFLYCAILVGFYALSALLSYALAVLMIHLSQRIVYTMRKEVFDHLTELPVGFFTVCFTFGFFCNRDRVIVFTLPPSENYQKSTRNNEQKCCCNYRNQYFFV